LEFRDHSRVPTFHRPAPLTAPEGAHTTSSTTFHRDHINDRAAETEKKQHRKDGDGNRDPHRGPPDGFSEKPASCVPTTD